MRCFGPYPGLALDILLFTAAKTLRPAYHQGQHQLQADQTIFFRASDIYSMFGHSRANLLSPASPETLDTWFKYEPDKRGKYEGWLLDSLLYQMSHRNLTVDERLPYVVARPSGKGIERVHDGSMQLFRKVTINREPGAGAKRFPVGYELEVDGRFIQNNHLNYQTIYLDDYLRLVSGTSKRSWTNARMLYLRLRNVWGMWQRENMKQLDVSFEHYFELCHMLDFKAAWTERENVSYKHQQAVHRKNAFRLKELFAACCQLESIPFVATITPTSYADRNEYSRQNKREAPPYKITLRKKSALSQQELEQWKLTVPKVAQAMSEQAA
ncbi:hypothetical protein ACFPAF_16520 [Hymenobacter endophyticus]|uniref:RepB family plasmid replication initiator protein n=1 Tax=Hymenobacter endophyticus TaxID=3076335 RepID=A0ABU3TKV6_9BACT|nr:hypothetical protein [Hymenobacter endophyticus]MDU0372008.1 hypothetical protein [Hymenobacter endophyticus]